MQSMAAAGLEGVLLGGNYVSGVALGKCVEYGYEFAQEVRHPTVFGGLGFIFRGLRVQG